MKLLIIIFFSVWVIYSKDKNCSYSLLFIFKESYFILKYDAEAVAAAKERGDEVSEDGVEEAFDVSVTIPNYRYFESLMTQ